MRYVLAVVHFSGLQPLPEAKTLIQKLVRRRTTLGMSQEVTKNMERDSNPRRPPWEDGHRKTTQDNHGHDRQPTSRQYKHSPTNGVKYGVKPGSIVDANRRDLDLNLQRETT